MKKVLFASVIGNIIEFYDFAIYGFLATSIASAFFPSSDALVSLISVFGVFTLGFFARPFGSILFGYVGDRKGRKHALSLSIFIMAMATLAIALLPTYSTLGVYATLLLTLLRIIQGMCLGGEFTGSLIFVLEHNLNYRKGIVAAIATAAGLFGWLLGAALSWLCMTAKIINEAWRVPFLIGSLGALVAYYIRSYTDEPPLLNENSHRSNNFNYNSLPLLTLMNDYRKNFLCVVGVSGLIGTLFYGQFIFLNSFLQTSMSISSAQSLSYTTLGIALYMLFLLPCGWISEAVGYYRLMIISSITVIFLAYPLFTLIASGTHTNIILVEVISSLLLASYMAPTAVVITEMFPIDVRYTGVSLGYNIGMSLIGGTTPLIFSLLIQQSSSVYTASAYLGFAALVGLMSTVLAVKNAKLKTEIKNG